MNLAGIANPYIQQINANQSIVWSQSTGYTTDAAGKRTPTYTTTTISNAQIQPLSQDDLSHISGLNIQGITRAIYIYQDVRAIIRASQKGGDIVTFPQDGVDRNWKVLKVLELWPDWSKVVVVMQDT